MSLSLDIPAMPGVIRKLTVMLQSEDLNTSALGDLVATDMALAAALMQAVKSARLGLRTPPRSVHEAVNYLGLKEVSAITYEVAMRAAFPAAPELDAVWQRASRRADFMRHLAQGWRRALARGVRSGVGAPPDPYVAHAAGLFEECGKAVLFRHATAHYRTMLRAAPQDADLATLERVAFKVGHDELGARLCEAWGLAPEAVACVRQHLQVRQALAVAPDMQPQGAAAICALSVLAWHALERPAELHTAVEAMAPVCALSVAELMSLSMEAAGAAVTSTVASASGV
jgi:HD-like signal output (HDOD) protein